MAQNYLVTSHHSTAVDACDTGNFTSSSDLNLVIARNTKIEIMAVTPEGLRSIREFNINGSVEVMKLFRPVGAEKDRLFIITKRQQAMILEAQTTAESISYFEIVTKAHGDLSKSLVGKYYFIVLFRNKFTEIYSNQIPHFLNLKSPTSRR